MSDFKPRLKIVSMAVLVAMAGITACNDDSSDKTATTVKDDNYYKSLAESMVAQMTTSEKLDIASGPGMGGTPINLENNVSGVAGYINGVKNDKLDIPAIKLADGPAGLRISGTRDGDSGTYYATAWPIGSLLASTWDTGLIEQVGKAVGEEIKEYGVDILLAPGMNIQRNPLNGRNFEYYSEDPLVTGRIGAAMVNGVESLGVGTTIKHYFGNNSETNRNSINSIGEPRTFREIYLRGFQIAVDEAQPWAVMTSYNKANGTYVNQRRDTVTSILRDEWGFSGLVMSDWFAGNVRNDASSAAAQLNAGNDLIEPGGQKDNLQASMDSGDLTEAQLNENVVHILTQVQKSPSYNHYVFSNNPDLNAHAVLARTAATEGMVLLRNESALPIAATAQKVASFGVNQIATYKGGTGSGDVNAAYTVSTAQGLANKFTVNTDLETYYSEFYEANKVYHAGQFGAAGYYTCDEASVTDNQALTDLINASALTEDVAVINIGRQAGEGADRASTEGDYLLSANEAALIEKVAAAFHAQDKKVVVVLNVNGVIDTNSWKNEVDGILLAYMGGQDTGNAIADVLSGDVNPSGKLAQTFPASYNDVPSSATFPGVDTDGDGKPNDIYYNEGIYVGYRYYSSFDKAVSYPFGYGLSYTNFSYANAAVTENTLDAKGAAGSVTLTATITNSGSVAGKEAAQVYISAPEVKLKKPTIELKAFAKTSELSAGSAEKLTFTIPAKILASFDPSSNAWIVEPGTYKAYVSPSSDVSDVAPVTFTVAKEIRVSGTTAGALALPDGVDAASFTTVSE